MRAWFPVSLSLHKMNPTVYQAVHPWVCSEACIFMQLQKVAWDGDQTKADGRHLEEVSRKPAGAYILRALRCSTSGGPYSAAVGKGFPVQACTYLAGPRSSCVLAGGGQEPWNHCLECARRKGSEISQDVSVVHSDDGSKEEVVSGHGVKPN